jgi:hypothetical protein
MSVKIMTRIWESSPNKGSALLTELAIGDNANDYGVSWPALSKEIAKKTRLKPRTLSNLVRDMVANRSLIVYPWKGRQHTYINVTGMTQADLKEAIRWVADKRKMTIAELSQVRKEFYTPPTLAKDATPLESVIQGDQNQDATDPSYNHQNRHDPEGLPAEPVTPDDASQSDTSKKSAPPSGKGRAAFRLEDGTVGYNHPGMVAYREKFRRSVHRSWMQRVADAVDKHGLEAWEAVLDLWAGQGWNPGSVAGMIGRLEKDSSRAPAATPAESTFTASPELIAALTGQQKERE